MRFLNPSAFYLFGLIPVVALLHFLKLRRKRHVVPSVMLWLEAIEDMKANVPFQRLRNSLLLPLQILFLLIAIGGVARPALRQTGTLSAQSIVIVDTSASMQATDLGKSRLDVAKTEALKLMDRLTGDGRMMIMDTSRPPRNIRQPFTSDQAKLRQTIADLPAQYTSPDLKAVFDSAQVYASTPDTQVFFISDNFENLPVSSHLHRIGVGERSDNVGIVQFSVTRDANQPNLYQCLVGLQSFADTPQEFHARLEIEGHWIDDAAVVLSAKETKSIVLPFDDAGFDGQVVSVRLDIDDDLVADNVASAILHPPSKWKVLLVTDREQPLLTAMLKTNSHVNLNQIQPQDYHGLGESDIVIFDQFVPEALPEGNAIFLNPLNGLPFMPVEKNRQPTRVIDQNRTHPVMRDVSLIDLSVKESLNCQLPIWGIPLVETTQQTPLIWLGEDGDRKVIVFAFNPFDLKVSPFALFEQSIASAPILISQCLEWLAPAPGPIQPDAVKTGEPVSIRLDHPDEVERVAVQSPDGTQANLTGKPSQIIFTETDQIGVYTVFVDGQPLGRFAVNLLNAQESDLSPPQLVEGDGEITDANMNGEQMQPEPQSQIRVNREIWGYAAFFALSLLVVEWWVYHRNVGR
ncbi:BatA domain-containing protein [Candidatus Poribacteria bacterium]|nr:BatA domain-containing protein [Candidatus Poribacteria bacterium]